MKMTLKMNYYCFKCHCQFMNNIKNHCPSCSSKRIGKIKEGGKVTEGDL